jgi:hypothetical protein
VDPESWMRGLSREYRSTYGPWAGEVYEVDDDQDDGGEECEG